MQLHGSLFSPFFCHICQRAGIAILPNLWDNINEEVFICCELVNLLILSCQLLTV